MLPLDSLQQIKPILMWGRLHLLLSWALFFSFVKWGKQNLPHMAVVWENLAIILHYWENHTRHCQPLRTDPTDWKCSWMPLFLSSISGETHSMVLKVTCGFMPRRCITHDGFMAWCISLLGHQECWTPHFPLPLFCAFPLLLSHFGSLVPFFFPLFSLLISSTF